jgi:hypothetical protein
MGRSDVFNIDKVLVPHSPEVKQLVNDPPPDKWRTIRIRRIFVVAAFCVYFFAPILIMSITELSEVAWFFVWLGLFIPVIVACVRLFRSLCPNCGKRFYYRRFFNPLSFSLGCAHCRAHYNVPLEPTLPERLELDEDE